MGGKEGKTEWRWQSVDVAVVVSQKSSATARTQVYHFSMESRRPFLLGGAEWDVRGSVASSERGRCNIRLGVEKGKPRACAPN